MKLKNISFFQTTGQLCELLETALSWDFEIFRLEEITRGRPLAHLGRTLMGRRFDVCSTLDCDERTLLTWLTTIETNYHADNRYHNSTHAADVLQVGSGVIVIPQAQILLFDILNLISRFVLCGESVK